MKTPDKASTLGLSSMMLSKTLMSDSTISKMTSSSSSKLQLPSPIPLTTTSSSWIIHVPNFFSPPSRKIFQEMFHTHPNDYHPLFLFGKQTYENRYSQLFVTNSHVGESYKYSGTSKPCITCNPKLPEQEFVMTLCHVANVLVTHLATTTTGLIDPNLILDNTQDNNGNDSSNGENENNNNNSDTDIINNNEYNCCLVNWYKPEHTIGLHSDDEMEMNLNMPIMSLSWGGPRRFLLRPKPKSAIKSTKKVHEILLKNGDLLIMGGKCQEEFKHEIPKVRKTMDGLVDDRMSWTIRCMNQQTQQRKQQRQATNRNIKRKKHNNDND